ncbi:DUF6455 family protein [Methylobrevis pamukkalensis]|uniref:DUF6455 domain-containing protein n=1 Tax=Methylobrevis pamukkalensis TaxID=1439726 RepID=A0A1E3H128_9HYPH|nr:DUF6455 family protein [Methylobrevis pamukkalensis]ODN70033.1 hypothetical protein A6302_02630 [Methylobrevis pamukkalensis]
MANDTMTATRDLPGSERAMADVPVLMARMATTLGVVPQDHFTPAEISAAGRRCDGCADKAGCREWLEIAAIRGADRPPRLCANHDLFDAAVQTIDTI